MKYRRIQYRLGSSIIFVLFFLVSCSKLPSAVFGDESDVTLKQKITDEKSRIVWTEELEKKLLSENITKEVDISDKIPLTPDSMYASLKETGLYPSLKDFGSLDISKIPHNAQTVVDGFCTAVLNNKNADGFIAAGRQYTLVLFLSAIKKIRLSYAKTLSAEMPFFVSWIPGEPFITSAVFFVPVRLKTLTGVLDIRLFLDQKSAWKIDRISILKYVENNDE